MPAVPRNINSVRVRPLKRPAWGGPIKEGISYSSLAYYLVCKERFRICKIDGITTIEEFNAAIEFGSMWHVCEEVYARNPESNAWQKALHKCALELAEQYRKDQYQVFKWYNVVRVQFPIYVEYWSEHLDTQEKIPLLQEERFLVDYKLPSGRTVLLKGMWDSVDWVKGIGIFIQENKTKSTISVEALEKQLTNDLQTMMYLVALREFQMQDDRLPADEPIVGVRYNVIRRALGGGKGSIRPKKATKYIEAETMDHFYERLDGVIRGDMDDYFKRWDIRVSEEDTIKFQHEVLNPILENLCDDYEWWCFCQQNKCTVYDGMERAYRFPRHNPSHYRLPYGVYNIIHQGGADDLDNYINTGSTIGLRNLPEFKEEECQQ